MPIIVKGEGTDKSNSRAILRRAKSKVITQKVILSLIEVAKERNELNRVKAYWNTYHCQNRIFEADDKLFGNYCKNRFCTICAGIRKAEIINKYWPIISEWKEPYFLTLTAKSVPANKLKSRMQRMLLSLKKILNRNKKRYMRGKGIKFEGIRSLECNFNPVQRWYNPHFHIIVSTKEAAELILKEWLIQCTPKFALIDGQKIRKVEDKVHDLIEVVKYGSKIFTDPTMKKRAKRTVAPYIYVSAFHNIIWAMSGHRIFERFGFNLPPRTKETKMTLAIEYEQLKFAPELFDWVNEETAELLSGYQPTGELLSILRDNINFDLQ
ncbi:MAG: protein rep [Saprospiraceae bacterium]|nr:protein rep [Saprospiraceae bacterium]